MRRRPARGREAYPEKLSRRAVSKRRFQAPEEREVEELTPEERRAQRRRERAKRKAGHAPSSTPKWRKVAVVGIPVAVIAVVAAFLIFSNLPTPCVQFTAIPNSAPGAPNEPTFPTSSQGGFGGTWCISSTPVYSTTVYLKIAVLSNTVAVPGLIGERTNYSAGTCDLPLHTLAQPPPPGVIQIDSPWAYQYNLSMFFNVWSQSFSHAYVDAANSSQPIIYQSDDLLGFKNNATDSVALFVDGQPSSAGPSLDLTTLAYSVTNPSCLGNVYGSGHTILLTYTKSTGLALAHGASAPTLSTGSLDPSADAQLYDGPLPHFGLMAPLNDVLSTVHWHSLGWLVLRTSL